MASQLCTDIGLLTYHHGAFLPERMGYGSRIFVVKQGGGHGGQGGSQLKNNKGNKCKPMVGDWKCKVCSIHDRTFYVFASRSTCPICNGSKGTHCCGKVSAKGGPQAPSKSLGSKSFSDAARDTGLLNRVKALEEENKRLKRNATSGHGGEGVPVEGTEPTIDIGKACMAVEMFAELYGEDDARVVETRKQIQLEEDRMQLAKPLVVQAKELEQDVKVGHDKLSRAEKGFEKALEGMDLARKKLREAEAAMVDRRNDLATFRVDLERVRERIGLEREAALRKEAVEAEQSKKKEDECGAPDTNLSFNDWLAQKYPGWSDKVVGWPQHLKEGMEQQLRSEHEDEREEESAKRRREAVAAERQKAVDPQVSVANAQQAARAQLRAVSGGPASQSPGAPVHESEDIDMLVEANAEEAAKAIYSLMYPDNAWSEVEGGIRKGLIELQLQLAKRV